MGAGDARQTASATDGGRPAAGVDAQCKEQSLSLQLSANGLQRPKIVLFDAVGTLIEAWPPVAEAYLEIGRRFGSRRDLGDLRGRFRESFARHNQPGTTSEDVERRRWRAIVGEVLDDVRQDGDRLFAALWDHFALPESWRVYDDVPAAWEALEQRGLRLGVASNFDERLVSVCRGLAPLDRADFVFCSSQLGYSKPCLEFYRSIEEAVQLTGRQILLIGDDYEADVLGARRAGWQALYLDRAAQAPGLPTLQSLHDLHDVLPA